MIAPPCGLTRFEWIRGYEPRITLAAVDRTTFMRTGKPSTRRLGAIARAAQAAHSWMGRA